MSRKIPKAQWGIPVFPWIRRNVLPYWRTVVKAAPPLLFPAGRFIASEGNPIGDAIDESLNYTTRFFEDLSNLRVPSPPTTTRKSVRVSSLKERPYTQEKIDSLIESKKKENARKYQWGGNTDDIFKVPNLFKRKKRTPQKGGWPPPETPYEKMLKEKQRITEWEKRNEERKIREKMEKDKTDPGGSMGVRRAQDGKKLIRYVKCGKKIIRKGGKCNCKK